MELTNELAQLQSNSGQDLAIEREALRASVLMLAPIVPHICHHLWQTVGDDNSVMDAPWPLVDESALVRDSIELVVQVNGKVRAKMDVAADINREVAETLALEQPNVQKFLQGVSVRKVIVVPGRLVNIVAN